MTEFWRIEPDWRGETVVIIAGGPSLSLEQIRLTCKAHLAGKCRVIAVNDAIFVAWFADMLYACDLKWWEYAGSDVLQFPGLKVTQDQRVPVKWPQVKCLQNSVDPETKLDRGFDADPTRVRCGRNSGYQAMHIAAHKRVARILLLGFDMRHTADKGEGENVSHWHGVRTHPSRNMKPDPTVYERAMLPAFETLAEPLARRGVEVLNCTPGSALTIWPMADLAKAL